MQYRYSKYCVGYYLHSYNRSKLAAVVLQSPLRLIIEPEASSKLWTSFSEGEDPLLLTNHRPSVLPIFKVDPVLSLIVGYDSFPIPPEIKGEYVTMSVVKVMFKTITSSSEEEEPLSRSLYSASVREGEERLSSFRPHPILICDGDETRDIIALVCERDKAQQKTAWSVTKASELRSH